MSDRAEVPGTVSGRAHARAGLLGNPSDVYGGKAIAVSICNFAARVSLEPATTFAIDADPDAVGLLRAAVGRFPAPPPDAVVRMTTDVPRQVGLAGSSAIIVAALRALERWHRRTLPPAELAERALAAEAEDLGITAGPMDRVIQAYEGALLMDFAEPRTEASYTRLDPALLPPLFVAWDPEIGKASDVVHSDVRARWLRGDPDVRRAIAIFPALVDQGVACLRRGDHAGFRALVDRNFDTRASIWHLRARDVEMVRIGRARGAAVKFCGSGGAVVGVLPDDAGFPSVEKAYTEAGFRALVPRIEPDPLPAADTAAAGSRP